MEKTDFKNPFKIILSKHKRYGAHYDIPCAECLVVPLKKYGDQISCDVIWRNSAGEVEIKTSLMFDLANLDAVDALKDYKLFELWETYSSTLQVQPG
jgi:hypothetical protein